MLQGDELASLVAQHEAIVHLAAQTGVASSVADPMGDFDINAAGTLRVLEACRQAGPKRKRLVFASSNAVIGRQPPPATEEAAPMPTSPYGASKLAGEGYCLAYGHCWPIDPVVLRLGNVYGPCSHHKGSVVARFFKDILTRGGSPSMGTARRPAIWSSSKTSAAPSSRPWNLRTRLEK